MRVPVGAQTKAAQTVVAKVPKHIVGLFVEPILIKGEEPSHYWNLVSAMIDDHQPQSSFEWFALIDLVAKLWEERFYRRASNATMRGGQRQAVEEFLIEIRPGEARLKSSESKPEREADKYFSGSKEERDEVQSRLAEYEITEAEVLARSAQNNINAIVTFDQLASSRERGRRKLQKEMKQRQASRKVQPSQEVKSEFQGDVAPTRLEPPQVMHTKANDNSKAHHHGHPRHSQVVEGATTGKVIHQIAQVGSCQEGQQDRDVNRPGIAGGSNS
jgi:hypothetical protein